MDTTTITAPMMTMGIRMTMTMTMTTGIRTGMATTITTCPITLAAPSPSALR